MTVPFMAGELHTGTQKPNPACGLCVCLGECRGRMTVRLGCQLRFRRFKKRQEARKNSCSC